MNINKSVLNAHTNVFHVNLTTNVKNVLKEEHYQTVIVLLVNTIINWKIQIAMIVWNNVKHVQVKTTIAINAQETD